MGGVARCVMGSELVRVKVPAYRGNYIEQYPSQSSVYLGPL